MGFSAPAKRVTHYTGEPEPVRRSTPEPVKTTKAPAKERETVPAGR